MGPTLDSRVKSPDAGILVLQIAFEVGVVEHNSLVE